MAINVYTGLQGSGKSYEVVGSVIVPACRNGRRIVTNIDGIDQAAIHKFLNDSTKSGAVCRYGEIMLVSDDDIKSNSFFPNSENRNDTTARPGDLIVIDEAWRFWPMDGGRLVPAHMEFFRMHRHYVDELTGVSCDVALITQDVAGLHRSLRNVIEVSFRTTKLKSLGLSKTYRLELFDGYKQIRKSRLDIYVKRYRPEIFNLYRSYATRTGTEISIDSRQNIFGNRTLWIYCILFAALTVISVTVIWHFFHPIASTKTKHVSQNSTDSHGAPQHRPRLPSSSSLPLSTSWRFAGRIRNGEISFVILQSPTGTLRLERAQSFRAIAGEMAGAVDDSWVTRYSGGEPQ
jgi:zona occludens toxin